MDIQQIRDYAQSLDSADRALFAHELRKLAGEIDGVGSKGKARGKTQEAIESLQMASNCQRAVLKKLKDMRALLDDE
jgi:hypothetical protein